MERVCRSNPSKFDCLIVYLVRDLRAVLSCLIAMLFLEGACEKSVYSAVVSLLKLEKSANALFARHGILC